MARRGEGHLLLQADLNKQLCSKYIINKKLIIPACKHYSPLWASWLPGSLTPGSPWAMGTAQGGDGMSGRVKAA